MSVKKILLLSAAGLAVVSASAVFAGGPDAMAMPAEPAFHSSLYVEAHGGYAQGDWSDYKANALLGVSGTSDYKPTVNGKGSATGGGDIGYNITQHIATEAGGFYLGRVRGEGTRNGTLGAAPSQKLSAYSYVAYAAAKLSVPVADNWDLFGKVGVGYRGLEYKGTRPANISRYGHYWAPVFGTGVQYTMDDSWIFGAQYFHVPSNGAVNVSNTSYGAPDAAPTAHLYTGYIGYKFNV